MDRLALAISMLYDSEINFRLSCFWDAGYLIEIGDEHNGWKGEGRSLRIDGVPDVLMKLAAESYPQSEFAKWFKEQGE